MRRGFSRAGRGIVRNGGRLRQCFDLYEALLSNSPDGRTALFKNFKGLALPDIQTGCKLRSFTGHSEYITSAAYSPDGRLAVSSGMDDTVRLWDIAIGRELRTFTGHTLGVNSVCISPDGRTALSVGGEGSMKVWDISGY